MNNLDKMVRIIECNARFNKELLEIYESFGDINADTERIKSTIDNCQSVLDVMYEIQRTKPLSTE